MNDTDKKLLLELQKGIEIEQRPFLKIAERVGVREAEVVSKTNHYLSSGLIRRFGAVFDPSNMGYQSILCGTKVLQNDIDRVSKIVHKYNQVTHCYIRDHQYNLWFTFSEMIELFDSWIERLLKEIDAKDYLILPAIKKFKTNVMFGFGLDEHNLKIENSFKRSKISSKGSHFKFNSKLCRAVWSAPIEVEPFKKISDEIGLSIDEVVLHLNQMISRGAIKRVSAIPYHMRLGFSANAMCVWDIANDLIERCGKILSTRSDITHCYERERVESFPYNLFAMIHKKSQSELVNAHSQMCKDLDSVSSIVLNSILEIKKTSFKPF